MTDPGFAVVPGRTTEVVLVLPIEADWLALARTTGAAVAARADFTYDEIADLRLAIDELCLSLIESHASIGRIELVYRLTDELIRVEANLLDTKGVDGHHSERAGQEFSERILDALVDAHGKREDEPGAWFQKRRAPR